MLRALIYHKKLLVHRTMQYDGESSEEFILRTRQEIITTRARVSHETGRDALIRTLPKSPSGHKKRLVLRIKLFNEHKPIPWPKLPENKKKPTQRNYDPIEHVEGIDEL